MNLVELAAACALSRGQTRTTGRRVTNALWFDHRWRMIGWGDLAEYDLIKVAKTLPFGMLFVVVPQTALQPFEHDLDTITWLVERGSIYLVLRGATSPSDETSGQLQQIRFRKIIRPTVTTIFERFARLNS